jgi:hypothetical protein
MFFGLLGARSACFRRGVLSETKKLGRGYLASLLFFERTVQAIARIRCWSR